MNDGQKPAAGVDLPCVREGFAHGWRGVPIHYSIYGRGEPALACCNGLGVSTFFWKYLLRYFAATHRIVTWDYRGHYRSGTPERLTPAAFSMESNARDLAAVLDASRIARAVVFGHSMGCQVLLEFWRRYPQRVAGLVPICGPFGHPLDTFFDSPQFTHLLFDTLYTVATTYPRTLERLLRPLLRSRLPFEIARLGLINRELAGFDDMQPYFEHLSRLNVEVFFRMAAEMQRHDAGPWLRKINVPTLVVVGESDLFTPLPLSMQMRDKIPGAELLLLRKGSHAALIEQPELLNLRIEKFLDERVQPFRAAQQRKRLPRRSRRAPATGISRLATTSAPAPSTLEKKTAPMTAAASTAT